MRLAHFEKEDVLHIVIAEGPEVDSVEIAPNITAELNANGELIGIEIMEATKFFRDYVLDSMQAKVLGLKSAGTPG